MPRYVNRRRRLSTKVRAERAVISRSRKGRWIDPFPWIIGTVPEKMVYAELSQRGIRFAFQNEVAFRIPEISFNKSYRPDIIIPDYKIIIEVQGSYWHSQKKAIEDDAYKFAIYQVLGWKVLVWWDYDILDRLQELFASVPQFRERQPQGDRSYNREYIYKKKVVRDDTKGIRTMNRNRALRKAYKKPAPRIRI